MINTTMSPVSKADGRLVTHSKRQLDPILQELYEVEAQLNAEAGYSLEVLLERAGLGVSGKATQNDSAS